MNNGFKNNAVTFTNKLLFTLKIKLKTRSSMIYEARNFIDNEANYCCSQQLNRIFNEFSCSCETSKMFKTSIKYQGVYKFLTIFLVHSQWY